MLATYIKRGSWQTHGGSFLLHSANVVHYGKKTQHSCTSKFGLQNSSHRATQSKCPSQSADALPLNHGEQDTRQGHTIGVGQARGCKTTPLSPHPPVVRENCPLKCFFPMYSPLKSCSMCKQPCKPLLNIALPFKRKKKRKEKTINSIWITSCYICCPGASLFLAYFSLCDCSRVVIPPPAISPPVSMVKPIVDSFHVYEYTY